MLSHVSRSELAGQPISALAVRGKELQVDAPAAEARSLLERHAVKLLPVLSGGRYVGAVDRETVADVRADVPVGTLVRNLAPVAPARTRAEDALAALDEHGGTRLVVVEDDGSTYVGVVCLRGDRVELCADRERLGLEGPDR